MNKKDGDAIAIGGDYQYRALTEGYSVQRFWHRAKLLAIRKFLPPRAQDRVLDIGCGSGVVSGFLGESGAHVVGLDTSAEAIRFATARYGSEQVKFVRARVDEAPPVERPVDKIYCLELLEHIHRPQAERMLDFFRDTLTNDGKVFLTTPNVHSAWPAIEWLLDHSGLVPVMAGHQHVEMYHPAKMAALCVERGFRVSVLTTMCTFSPWLAPISQRVAERVFQKETEIPFCLGPVLVVVLEKKG